jgi:copper homeostasis protein
MATPLLEICAYNVHACMIAEKLGAGRIELCSNPKDGGITPGFGTLEYVAENAKIPVYVMIRPRGGNFVYDEHELAIMQKDIKICKILGFAGVVLGILTADNKVDINATKTLVEYAYPMGVTFHKAFDRVADARQALEDIIAAGCERVLTSGLAADALQGADTLRQLINQADGRITIMPGGGVRGSNIAKIMGITGATEMHSSALTASSTGDIADESEVMALLAGMK